MANPTTAPDVFEALRDLALPEADYAVFGSGPLIVRRIAPFANDLDVVCRGAAWSYACQRGELVHLDDHGVDVVSVLDGRITIGRSWAYGTPDIDELIDTAELINGLPFVRLSHVIEYKTIAGRPKDLAHLEALRAWHEPA